MAEQTGTPGPQDDFLNYALGQGWYSMIPEYLNSINSGRQGRAAAGTGILGHLTQLLTNPGGGNLGLARQAAYGNGGPAIDMTGPATQYQDLLDKLTAYAGGVNATAEDAPYKAAPVDPNNAPGPTPENAAKAPNTAEDWLRAYQAYHPSGGVGDAASTKPPGMKSGGKVETNDDGSRKLPHPIDEMLNRTGKVHKAVKALADVAHMGDKMHGMAGGGMAGGGVIPGYEDGGLAALASVAPKDPEGAMKYWAQIQRLGMANEALQRAGAGTAENIIKGLGVHGDALNQLVQPQMYSGNGPEPTPKFTHISQWSPEVINKLLSAMVENTRTAAPGDYSFQFADGGVTLGGQPHWIVDANGYPVAAITEDGSPENVRGLKNGGVEVTPLRPDRFEQYTGQAPGQSDIWARMLARMDVANGVPGAATGQQFMFPDIPGSQVDTSPQPGSNQIPSWGGATEPIPTGPTFGAGATPKTFDDYMRLIQGAPGKTGLQQDTSILGGALKSTHTNLNDLVNSINNFSAGGANPIANVSAQQFASMDADQQAAYTALLQRMGVSAANQADFRAKTTPAGLG